MPYIQTKTRAGKTLIIEKYYSGRYRKKNTLRQKNFRKTTEAQEACNERKARRNLTALINANFGSDDYHLVLDYRPEERPATVEEAKDNIRPFIRSLRRMYKKAGLQLKYVESCEFGKKGALHHHLVINGGVPTAEIARKWKYGWSHFNQLDDTGEYSRLASYIIKNRKQWKRCGGTGRQYSHSRDMKMPERKTEVIKTRDGYYEKPRERKRQPKAAQTARVRQGTAIRKYSPKKLTGYASTAMGTKRSRAATARLRSALRRQGQQGLRKRWKGHLESWSSIIVPNAERHSDRGKRISDE